MVSNYRTTEVGRIPLDWYEVVLENLIEECTERTTINDQYEILTSSRNGIYPQSEYFKRIVASKDNVGYRVMRKGDFTYRSMSDDGIFVFNRLDSMDVGMVSPAYSVFHFKGQTCSDFYRYYLNAPIFAKTITRDIQGGTRLALRFSAFKKLRVACPPLPEQRKIAAILTSVDDAITATQRIIDQTEVVKRGLMQQLLTKGIGHTTFKQTEIGEIPTEWDVVTIGETCLVGTGGTPRRDDLDNWNGTIPWVKTTEIKNSIITQTEETITEHALQTSSVKMYPAGTVLLAMYGQGVTRGKCAVLGIEATTNQACAAMQPHATLFNRFLFYVLQYNYENIRELGHGSNQSNLNLNLVKSFRIPLPPTEEQKSIGSILETLDSKLDKERATVLALKRLKASMMQVLLTGKVRVNVDEPSEVSV